MMSQGDQQTGETAAVDQVKWLYPLLRLPNGGSFYLERWCALNLDDVIAEAHRLVTV